MQNNFNVQLADDISKKFRNLKKTIVGPWKTS